MQIIFYKEEMKKNIKFTKQFYSMNYLEGHKIFFDKFLPTRWKRIPDKKMNLEKFIELMKNCNFFVSKLFIAEDKYLPFRYSVNAKNNKTDSLLEIYLDLTNENFDKIANLYYETYNRYLQDGANKRNL